MEKNETLERLNRSITTRQALIKSYNAKLIEYAIELDTVPEESRRLAIIKDIRAIRHNRRLERRVLRQERIIYKNKVKHGS